MANICEYEVHVKGTKKAALMVLNSMPVMDYLDVKTEYSESNNYVICFTGDCNWSVNYGVTENEIQQNANNYWNHSLRAKSEMFQCEILVHYWSEESGFDQFDHYKNGQCIKQRKIAYNYDKPNKFDWNKTEFIGHEGVFDESVDGEEQDNNVMNMLLGVANGNFGIQEEPDNDMSGFLGQLNQINDLLQGIADELDIDVNDTSIDGTNFDLYKWTFTEGQSARGDGWTIAIPDGFKVIDSAENRVFEAVPIDCEDADEASVRILPGMSQDVSLIKKEMWMYHEKARAGIASILGVTSSKFLAQLMGSASLVLSVGWSDVCGYILVQDTGLGSCSYQIAILTDNCQYQLRVQTNAMTDEDKNTLSNSIIEWLKTMRLDKENKSCPKEPIIDSPSCRQCLEKGDTSLFELALEQAKNDCQAANNGLVAALEFAAENGLLDDNAPQMARNILLSRMEVQEFYLTKIDNVIGSVIKTQKGKDAVKTVCSKLKELCEPHTSFELGNEKIEVAETDKITEIRKNWRKLFDDEPAKSFGSNSGIKIDGKETPTKKTYSSSNAAKKNHPPYAIEVDVLEEEMVNYFKHNNELKTEQEVCEDLRYEIKSYNIPYILNQLCKKNILYQVNTALGEMFGLINDSVEVYVDEDVREKTRREQKRKKDWAREKILEVLLDPIPKMDTKSITIDERPKNSLTLYELQKADWTIESLPNLDISHVLVKLECEGLITKSVCKRRNCYALAPEYRRQLEQKRREEKQKRLNEQREEKQKRLNEQKQRLQAKFDKDIEEFNRQREKLIDILKKTDRPLRTPEIEQIDADIGKSPHWDIADLVTKLNLDRAIARKDINSKYYYYVLDSQYEENLKEIEKLKKKASDIEAQFRSAELTYSVNKNHLFRSKVKKKALSDMEKFETELKKVRAEISELEEKSKAK